MFQQKQKNRENEPATDRAGELLYGEAADQRSVLLRLKNLPLVSAGELMQGNMMYKLIKMIKRMLFIISEISKILKINLNTVNVRLYRARNQLKKVSSIDPFISDYTY